MIKCFSMSNLQRIPDFPDFILEQTFNATFVMFLLLNKTIWEAQTRLGSTLFMSICQSFGENRTETTYQTDRPIIFKFFCTNHLGDKSNIRSIQTSLKKFEIVKVIKSIQQIYFNYSKTLFAETHGEPICLGINDS